MIDALEGYVSTRAAVRVLKQRRTENYSQNSLRMFCIPSIMPASGPGINPNAISAQPIKKMVTIGLWYMGSHPNVARCQLPALTPHAHDFPAAGNPQLRVIRHLFTKDRGWR